MGIRNSNMDILDDLKVHCMCDDAGPKCLDCQAADEITRLRKLVVDGEAVVNDFLPNIGRCALQDYGRMNQFLLDAGKLHS